MTLHEKANQLTMIHQIQCQTIQALTKKNWNRYSLRLMAQGHLIVVCSHEYAKLRIDRSTIIKIKKKDAKTRTKYQQ